jgi:hypothetical protein
MRVKELIKTLEVLPPNLEVKTWAFHIEKQSSGAWAHLMPVKCITVTRNDEAVFLPQQPLVGDEGELVEEEVD